MKQEPPRGLHDALQALAQPADVQLRLLPDFVCPGPYMLSEFLGAYQVIADPFKECLTEEEAVVLYEVRRTIPRLFKSILQGSELSKRMFALREAMEEVEKDAGILSQEGIRSSVEWRTLRETAQVALTRLGWSPGIPSSSWQPSHRVIHTMRRYSDEEKIDDWYRVDLRDSYVDVTTGISEQFEVEIEYRSKDLSVEHLYEDDFHCGPRHIHSLQVSAADKAQMLTLLKMQHSITESLLPPDALLLDLIYVSFANWEQIHLWLSEHAVPFQLIDSDRVEEVRLSDGRAQPIPIEIDEDLPDEVFG
jgi:hypothetical protein